jgi:hypothetical protein
MMKCANSLNNRFQFIMDIWALHKVNVLISHRIDIFYFSLCRLCLMPQGTCRVFMKLVWEINIETGEFSFHLNVSDIIPKFYRNHNRFCQISVQWILLQRNVGHVYECIASFMWYYVSGL